MTIPNEIAVPLKDFLNKNKWIIITTATAVVMAYLSLFFLGKDNVIEQEAEKIIQEETGVSIDLTP